jgi:hypothetical protein
MTKKTFKFGKIDHNGTGRKINLAEVEVNFDGLKLSVCGGVWNSKQTDFISCGQNLDEMYKHLKSNKTFLMIYSLWKKYHLNDMTPGTPKQMAFLSTIQKPSNAEFYKWECEQLEKVDLLIDDLNGEPYKYGTKWLISEIPSFAKEQIVKLLEVA